MDQELIKRVSAATKKLFSTSWIIEKYDGDQDAAVDGLAPQFGFEGPSDELFALCIMRLEYPKDEDFVAATDLYYNTRPS